MYDRQLNFTEFFLNISFPHYILLTFGAIVFLLLPVVSIYPSEVTAETSNSSSFSITNNTSNNNAQDFQKSFVILVNNSKLLTQQYQNEIGKWQLKQYDNKTMISITDSYLPKYEKLVDEAESLQSNTTKYSQVIGLEIKSIKSEIESYKHFRNLLVTGNKTEDELSTQFLSDALEYEGGAFALFNNN